ncbi:MAG: Lrp/AsnC family transcriptional regulator [Pygmaiobacter massiliensis]|jgi:DNA-binding Lrp family transcriptional regulator|nr:Lrp/AsnC family transcriptional regulator [Pygmaiobacter massiliensis]
MERILGILEQNARLSVEDIAAMVDMTPAQVAAQIDAYLQAGVIKGYRTLIDWEKTDEQRVKALIDLKVSPKKDHGYDEIAHRIALFPEVESVMLMSGGYDLSLTMAGKSFQEIAMFVAMRLAPMDDVLSTATHFVLRTYKKHGLSYIAEQKDERGANC